jgi:Peptidase family S64
MARLSYDSIPQELLDAKAEAFGKFFTPEAPPAVAFAAFAAHPRPQHNVVGIGVGKKIVKGRMSGQNCVRIYVEKKLPESAIPDEFMLPTKVRNVPVDVIETGLFRVFASAPKERQFLRPARPGLSVGFAFSGAQAQLLMAGTFGAVVEKNGKKFILSNNHVLANENALPKGSPIFQPGLLDDNNPARNRIAKLTDFIPLAVNKANKVDCAIAEVDNSLINPRPMPKVNKLQSGQPVTASVGLAVEKVGRTTSYTTGKIMDVSANVKVKYDLGVLTFADQIVIVGDDGTFSQGGDSGSLIVDREAKAPVGLLFAGGAHTHTIANHIGEVLGALNVTIVV